MRRDDILDPPVAAEVLYVITKLKEEEDIACRARECRCPRTARALPALLLVVCGCGLHGVDVSGRLTGVLDRDWDSDDESCRKAASWGTDWVVPRFKPSDFENTALARSRGVTP